MRKMRKENSPKPQMTPYESFGPFPVTAASHNPPCRIFWMLQSKYLIKQR